MNSNDSMPKVINNYMILEQIGFGATSKVYKAVHTKSKQFVALKCFNKLRLEKKALDAIKREISILSEIDYPFIINYQETFEDENYIYVSMEYAEHGNLRDFMMSSIRLSDKIIRTIFTQLSLSIDHLHNRLKISHQDIKAENIMLDKFFNIKLIDFGFAEKFEDEDSSLTNYCGSPNYIAPEIVRREKFTCVSDVWSLGVLLYLMVFGKYPYEDVNLEKLLHKIAEVPIIIPRYENKYINEVLSITLQKNPVKRANISKVLKCSYINGMIEMSQYNNLKFNSALYCNGTDSHEEERKIELSKIDGMEHDLTMSERLFHRRDILVTLNNVINSEFSIPRSYKSSISKSCFANCAASSFRKTIGGKTSKNIRLNSWYKNIDANCIQKKHIT